VDGPVRKPSYREASPGEAIRLLPSRATVTPAVRQMDPALCPDSTAGKIKPQVRASRLSMGVGGRLGPRYNWNLEAGRQRLPRSPPLARHYAQGIARQHRAPLAHEPRLSRRTLRNRRRHLPDRFRIHKRMGESRLLDQLEVNAAPRGYRYVATVLVNGRSVDIFRRLHDGFGSRELVDPSGHALISRDGYSEVSGWTVQAR
jgi:hypothetical protein